MKKRLLFGIILSIVFLYLAFLNVDLVTFLGIFKRVEYGYAIPVVLANLLGFAFRAFRWGYILEPVKKIRFMNLFSSVMISFMANNVLPVRLGEFVRAYSIAKMENISKSSAFATVVLERVLDVFFILILFFLLIFLFPFALSFPEDFVIKTYYFLIFALIGLFVLIFMVWKKEIVLNIVEKIVSRFPKKIADRVHRIVNSFIKGLDFFRNTHHFIPIIIITILMWGFYIGSYYFAFMAFGFFENDLQTFLLAGVVVLVMSSVGVMIPSAPGAIGTFHYFCGIGLLLVGIADKNHQIAYAIFVHGVNYIGVTAVGLWFFIKENLRFSEMKFGNDDS
ncbi:flippase-like domain-containing protein [bacterium]|nr:flippase-like domain-containing protein [bacterium]